MKDEPLAIQVQHAGNERMVDQMGIEPLSHKHVACG